MQPDMTEQTSPYPIFSQPWWLDAVAPNQWDKVVIEKGGAVVARLPYVWHKKKISGLMLDMPKLTRSLGSWLRPYPGKYANRLAEEKELMTELIHHQLAAFLLAGIFANHALHLYPAVA
jgi:hypothetical protein